MAKLRLLVFLVILSGFMGYNSIKEPEKVDLRQPLAFPAKQDHADLPISAEGVFLGKQLFFDPILSRDSSISCSSCHKPESAFSDGGKTFSAGVEGRMQKRNTPPLFNLAWSEKFFWDGRAISLTDQAMQVVSSHNEMDLAWSEAVSRIKNDKAYEMFFRRAFPGEIIDSNLVTNALAQFQLTLISADSKFDRVLRGEDVFTKEEFAGFVFVNDQSMGNCLHCHTTDAHALGTNAGFANNGLSFFGDEGKYGLTSKNEDRGKFKVPSLRNLVFTAPYMHDGRFETLKEVLDFYSEGVHFSEHMDPQMKYFTLNRPLFSEEEKNHMLAFLKTMSDTTFVSNPEYLP